MTLLITIERLATSCFPRVPIKTVRTLRATCKRSVTCTPFLWFLRYGTNHYRNGTFQDDMLKNLRDVAIPGTGIPLHYFSYFKIATYWMIFVGYPIVATVAAVYATSFKSFNASKFMDNFVGQMINPQDWFSFWRLNCRLATFHSSLTNFDRDYSLEDKWKFLVEAERLNVAVTPYMKVSGIVCKHRNEEGGLGFESFKNASVGGDWIIQEKLSNGPFLSSLLPSDAPLSTFRIISSSRGGLAGLGKRQGNESVDIMISRHCHAFGGW